MSFASKRNVRKSDFLKYEHISFVEETGTELKQSTEKPNNMLSKRKKYT